MKDDDSAMTSAELAERAAALAPGLDALGVGHGERVAIVSHNSARMLEGFFGVTSWGRVYVPMNFRLSRDEVVYIVEHSGASVLLLDPEIEAALADVPVRHRIVLGPDYEALLRRDTAPEPWDGTEDDTATINYTSGLFSHPAVAEVAVIGVPSEKWGETIKALVVLAEGQQASEVDLIAHCKQRLAGYKAPTSVELREAIPRTATGKVQKFKLREQYWSEQSRQVS